MKMVQTVQELRTLLTPARRAGRRIGLVPTMGALHEGHRSLMRAARAGAEVVVVSIFVNPTQFGPNEDFTQYPRPREADLTACREEKVDFAFVPEVREMYPADSVSTVQVAKLTDGLCGVHRAGHFLGVTTVVAKLFNVVQPDVAWFGQKDAQQVAVIRRMVRDLLWPIEIVACPTVREPDGLALSSRNAYLSPEQRRQALSLSAALRWAADQIAAGHRQATPLLAEMRRQIESAGPCTIDYIELVSATDLIPLSQAQGQCLLALAVRIGQTRLIDNLPIDAG